MSTEEICHPPTASMTPCLLDVVWVAWDRSQWECWHHGKWQMLQARIISFCKAGCQVPIDTPWAGNAGFCLLFSGCSKDDPGVAGEPFWSRVGFACMTPAEARAELHGQWGQPSCRVLLPLPYWAVTDKRGDKILNVRKVSKTYWIRSLLKPCLLSNMISETPL